MKLVKSLLLGSAAGLMAVAGAQAADLPSRKAAPAEFVRICSAYGAGFFFIPGTETCLRVGGRVRAEYLVGERSQVITGGAVSPATVAQDAFGFRARGRLNVDARTQTGFGTLRTFFRFEMTSDSGQYNGAADAYNSSFNLDKAFIQFAGITAGKAQSFFDFYAADQNWGTLRGTDGANANVLAYTASFGGGFSATLSLEDGASRRNAPVGVLQGRDYPDVVAALRVDQSWGSAQLMGALHQVRAGTVGLGSVLGYNKTGYAIGAGVKINLPALAAGSNFMIEAVYAQGALHYLNARGTISARAGVAGSFGLAAIDSYDDRIVRVDGFTRAQLTKGFSVVASLQHFWTPQVRQSLFGSYMSIDYGAQGGLLATRLRDITEYRIGTNIIWSPVSGLDIGVEVLYANVEGGRRGLGDTKFRDDAWQARLRIQRDF
jgi:hypothetical protein